MFNIAKLLTQRCPLVQLSNVAVLAEDASLGVGLPMIVFNGSLMMRTKLKLDAALVHHTSAEGALIKVDFFRSLKCWMEDSLMMLLLAETSPSTEWYKIFWKKGIYKILTFTTSGDIHYYNPFEDILQNDCKIEEMWRNLNGWPIKLSAFPHPLGYSAISVGAGIDGSFMLELSRHLNFTPVIIKAKNYDEAMSKMLAKAVEMSVNALSMRFLNEDVSMTHAMYSDQKCVALRKGSVLRGWHVFLQTFRWDVWLAIICTAIITNWMVALVTRRRSWYEAVPTVLRAMFTVPLRRPPKSTNERIIIASCLLFGIVIMTTYQGNLYYFIKAKVKHKPPTTLSEIRLEIRGRHLPNDTTLTNRVFEKYAIRIRRKIFDLLMQTGQLSNLYLVPECLYTANFAYALRKGSVWLAPLNRFLLSMLEAGFPEAWYRRTVFTKKRISYKGKRKTVKSARVFTLRDLEVAIFVLLLGLTLSFVVFLLEILSATIASRNWFLRWKLKIRHDYVN